MTKKSHQPINERTELRKDILDQVRKFYEASRTEKKDFSPGQDLVHYAGRVHDAVSSGEVLSLRELVAKVQQILGKNLPIEFGGRSYRTREVFQLWKGTPLPTWQPKISLKSGLEELFAPRKQD